MRLKIQQIANVSLIILLLTGSVFASNGTQIGTVGARSTSMGSAFRGLADDWSAMFFNPAGLTQLEGWTIGFSGGLIAPRGNYEPAPYSVFPFSGLSTGVVDAEPNNFFVPSIGIFKQLNEKTVVGLGVYAPFGLGTEWDLVSLPADYGNVAGISKENEHFSDHQVISIQPTVAYQVSDKLSVGVGFCYMWGKMDLDQLALAYNPALQSWTNLTVGLASMGVALEPLTADQYRLAVETNLSGTGSAYGVNAGFLCKIAEKLNLGASVRYSTALALSGTFKKTYLFHGDAEKLATLNAIPAATLGGEATKQSLMAVFSGQSSSVEEDGDADLPLPMTVGAGLSYKALEKLTLTVDASWTNWASWDVISMELESGEEVTIKKDWVNTVEIGAGAEYLAMDNGTQQVFVRGGFYTVDTPSPDETMSPTILDPSRRSVITAGLGLNVGKWSFDLSGEYVLFGEKDIPASEYVYDASTGIADNYAGIYNFKAYVVTLGASVSL